MQNKEIKMELTKSDYQKILIFMNRARLEGSEAMAFVEIVAKIGTIINEGEKNEVNNTSE